MLGQYYYHEILRKTIIAFGTIFNDIHIRHRDGAGKETSDMRVASCLWSYAKIPSKT